MSDHEERVAAMERHACYEAGHADGAREYKRILTDLINGMRAAAEMNEGSAHSRYMEKACDVAEARMKKVTP